MSGRAEVPSVGELVAAVMARSTGKDSLIHGREHWQRVAAAGLALLEETPGADPAVVFLFALFHDAMRESDGHDPDHGRRGAALARELRGELVFDLAGGRMRTLLSACEGHEMGRTSSDPTVGVCWDSDRLNLWRVGVRPEPALLSTRAARREETILLGKELQGRFHSWPVLAEEYEGRGRRCSRSG